MTGSFMVYEKRKHTLSFYPSQYRNNRSRIDIYVALTSGLYLYDAAAHRLTQLSTDDIREQTGKQSFTQKAPVNLIYVADYEKMRGNEEFYAAVDTGFISQNVYLFCASEGLSTVVLGMVDKKGLHTSMKLKPSQHITLTQPVGYPPSAVKTALKQDL